MDVLDMFFLMPSCKWVRYGGTLREAYLEDKQLYTLGMGLPGLSTAALHIAYIVYSSSDVP